MLVKQHAEPKVAKVVVVAVTDMAIPRYLSICLLLLLCAAGSHAAVLDDDRVDILYQSYDGGGTEVEAPAIVVRKKVAENFALTGSYLVDMVSGASIDVEVGASEYTEERKEYGVGVEFLKEKAKFSLHYANSSENDYDAETVSIGVAQDFFGDLSTINMGLSLGDDVIGNSTDDSFEETAKHYVMNFGWTQIVTKNFIANVSLNKTIDEGYLQNPYRFIRYRDSVDPTLWQVDQETYPNTRSSDAWSIRGRYFVAPRHVVYASYRGFQDTWGIDAKNIELGYSFAYADHWLFDIKVRQYSQTDADFYRDLFEFQNQSNFQARDKELSKFSDQMISFVASYEIPTPNNNWVKKTELNLFIDHIKFDYDNFRDIRVTGVDAGNEPLYSFSANLLRFMVSIWF